MTKLNLTRRGLLIGGLAATTILAAPAWARDWENYGADPSYDTRAQAEADLPSVLSRVRVPGTRELGWPKAVIDLFKERVKTQGEIVILRKGDVYDWMRTGKQGAIWNDPDGVKVNFRDPPQPRARGVRRIDEVQAERWVEVYNGRTYELLLPAVCFNWLGRVTGVECVYINLEAMHGNTAALLWARRNQADDHCFYIRRIRELWQPDLPQDKDDWLKIRASEICGDCTLLNAEKFFGKPAASMGRIPMPYGLYQIRIAPGEMTAFCVVTPGADKPSSFTNAVQPRHYRQINGAQHATVRKLPQTPVGSAEYRKGNDLHFWAQNAQEEEEVLRLAQQTLAMGM